MKNLVTIRSGVLAVAGIIALTAVTGSFYTVSEGHVGIKKQFGEAVSQHPPGLGFKVPFIQDVEELEVRTRKNGEKMASSTHEQMPVTVIATFNWTVNKVAALDLYKQYGSLEQFESRVLDPRFRAAVKDAVPHYKAEQLIQDRATATALVEQKLLESIAELPVSVDSVQLENVQLPPKYIHSIETKQTEKNLADAEEHKLARQALEAQRAVNTAQAQADGITAVAIAEAEAIRITGLAQAEAIQARAKALGDNPLLIQLTEMENWNGSYVTTLMGTDVTPIMDMRKDK